MKCPVCQAEYESWTKVLSHVVAYHGSQPTRITCNIDGCQRTFDDAVNWRRHAYRFKQHRLALGLIKPLPPTLSADEAPVTCDVPNIYDGADDAGCELIDTIGADMSPADMYTEFHSKFYQSFLSFSMKIREQLLLPQSTVTHIVDGIEGLFELYSSEVFKIIKCQLALNSDVDQLEYIFEDESFFSNMCSAVRSDKGSAAAAAVHLPLVSPTEIHLGKSNHGKPHNFHIVPIISILSKVLAHDDIVDEILAHRNKLIQCQSENMTKLHDLVFDITDGDYGQMIDVPLMFYIDEFEPCNPIGSRKKIHKLSGVYFTLACLPPRLRSALKSIFLYCLAYHSYVKEYGYPAIFEHLIKELLHLHENMLEIGTNCGRVFKYKIVLQVFSADNLSAHDLLGLQRHFSSGKISRFCYIDHKDIRHSFDYTKCEMRNEQDYQRQLSELNQEVLASDFGIKGQCVFGEIPYIATTRLCPPDVMHDFMEGVVPIVICLALQNLIQKLKLNLSDINDAIQNFTYGKADKNNRYGPIISTLNLKKLAIPGTASEKLCLLRMLPLILQFRYPNKISRKVCGFRLLLLCLDISDIIMAPVINREWLAELHLLIIDHHSLVKKLNPAALKPKFHFLSHYPALIQMYGPPRSYYTLRFESVHQYFKRLTSRTRNFINLTHTLSTRYQNLKAFNLSLDKYFSGTGNVTGESKALTSLGATVLNLFKATLPNCTQDKVFVTNSVTLREVQYEKGLVYIIRLLHGDIERPEFIELETLICHDAVWYAVGHIWEAIGYCADHHAFEVSQNGTSILMALGSEQDHSALSLYTHIDRYFIPLKYSVTKHVSHIIKYRFCVCIVAAMEPVPKVYQVWNEDGSIKKAVMAATFTDLVDKGV